MALSPTSYMVLGLLERAGEATPYELKQLVAGSVGNFWSIPHSQLYAEPERLARDGLLTERREGTGRRRRVFTLTEEGRRALSEWRTRPAEDDLPELRDPGLLRLFFGADPARLAVARRDSHARKLDEYRARAAFDSGEAPRGPWLALEAGIRHEEEWVRFWSELAEGRSPHGA